MGCSSSNLLECMKPDKKLVETQIIPNSTNSLEGQSDVSECTKDLDDDLYEYDEKEYNHLESWMAKIGDVKGGDEIEEFEETERHRVLQSFQVDDDLEFPVKGPQDLNPNWLTTKVPNIVRVLLVFIRDDIQSENISSIIRRLKWHVTVASTSTKALEIFQTRYHDLVIIDHRGSQAEEANEICRSLRSCNYHHSSVIVAFVKKSYLMSGDNTEAVAFELLDVGFNRVLIESSHEEILINELVGIYASEVKPKAQLAAAHALCLAVDRCRDMIHVTDAEHVVMFGNKVSEKLLGYKLDELIGKKFSEIISCENFALMDQQLQRGREFEGNMSCKRKTCDIITINCRIVPFSAYGKKPTHYIYIHDTTYLMENMGVMISALQQHPRGSLNSLRRVSFDVKSTGSDTQRRSSLAKLNNLPLEAPITKVICLLSNAMTETTIPEVALQIDKAIEILKTTELYVPYMKEDNKINNDPVTTDLIGALLSAPQYGRESRRSSNDSSGRVSTVKILQQTNRQSKELIGPQEIEELLDKCLDWDFDVFKLEVLSGHRPLVYVGMSIMNLFEASAKLGCSEKVIQNWLMIVEANYSEQNTYHNSTHAADVLQAIAKFMKSEKLRVILDPLDDIAGLIAAATHDIGHPGRSSQFLCNSDSKLAILYNDLAVLESHHAALTFKLTLSDDNVNIFKKLDRETYKIMRQNIIDMILATEMSKHFEHLAKFVNVCSARTPGDSLFEGYNDSCDMTVLLMPENVVLVKRMMIKCADVSNPTRPIRNCIEWTRRIAEEYFSQTDEEKKMKMPVVMPMFDRSTCSIPKSQIGFMDYIINDMFEAWDALVDLPEVINHMKRNYDMWKEFHEQGISTLQDMDKLQHSLGLPVGRPKESK